MIFTKRQRSSALLCFLFSMMSLPLIWACLTELLWLNFLRAAGSDRCGSGLIHWEPTAVWLHKQADRLQLGFISCLIDYYWHNSCQWREWWLTNDSAGSAVREITSTLSEATQQSSLRLSQCLFTATLNHCPTDNTDKTPAIPFGLHGKGSLVNGRHTHIRDTTVLPNICQIFIRKIQHKQKDGVNGSGITICSSSNVIVSS